MNTCPFCGRDIQASDGVCSSCGKSIGIIGNSEIKWYHTKKAVIIGLLIMGPLALPLVWINPRFNLVTKITITIVVLAATVLICYLIYVLLVYIIEQYQQMLSEF
jgi:uncharacterized membrane protein YvbJ